MGLTDMQVRDYKKVFYSLFKSFFQERGFFKKGRSLDFQRKVNDVIHRIYFGPGKDRNDGAICDSVAFSILIPEMEALTKDDPANVGMPIHLLKPGKEYGLWAFHSEAELKQAKPYIISEIQTYGFPFLNRYYNSQQVLVALQSECPKHWFMNNLYSRNRILVWLTFIRDGQNQALDLGKELLKDMEGKDYIKDIRIKRFGKLLEQIQEL